MPPVLKQACTPAACCCHHSLLLPAPQSPPTPHPTPLLLHPGPNGCGKSTLVRALCGLHPVEAGSLQFPTAGSTLAQPCGCASGGVMVVPQRPLAAPAGGLWQQVCYPGSCAAAGSLDDSPDDGRSPSLAGLGQEGSSSSGSSGSCRPSDSELLALLRRVGLETLVDRVGGSFTAAADWAAMLSPGELQRLSIARVLHRCAASALFVCTIRSLRALC